MKDMKAVKKDYSHIKGWGIDADPQNDPTYPMRDRSKEDHKGYDWDRPTLQEVNEEILHSNERPNVSAVFGTSVPLSGLSGMIRRFAFRYSENSYLHWLPLLLADRINVLEGMMSDLGHGRFFTMIKEKAWGTLWQHDKKMFFRRVGPALAMVSAGIAWLVTRNVATKTA
jgi:hypothetical protein